MSSSSRALLPTPSASVSSGSTADSVSVQDHRQLLEALEGIGQRTADIKQQTGALLSATDTAACRREVSKAMQAGKEMGETVEQLLEGLTDSTGVSSSEQLTRSTLRQNISSYLITATKDMQMAHEGFKKQAIARERDLAKVAQAAQAAEAAIAQGGAPDGGDLEAGRRQQLQVQREEEVVQASVDSHGEQVDRYVSQISRIQKNFADMAQVVQGMANLVNDQSSHLDNIDVHMRNTANQTAAGTEQLLQTEHGQRKDVRSLLALLCLCVVFAVALAIAVLMKFHAI